MTAQDQQNTASVPPASGGQRQDPVITGTDAAPNTPPDLNNNAIQRKPESTIHKVAVKAAEAGNLAFQATINLGPEAAKAFGPIGFASGAVFADARDAVRSASWRKGQYKELDRLEKDLSTPDARNDAMSVTLALMDHARAKDIETSLATINSMELDNSRKEDVLARKLEDMEARRKKALEILGLPPDPVEPAQSSEKHYAADFPVRLARSGSTEGRAIKDFIRRQEIGKKPADIDEMALLSARSKFEDAMTNLSEDEKRAYEYRYIRNVESSWDKASVVDKKLAVQLLGELNDHAQQDIVRLKVAEVDLTGYPPAPKDGTVLDPQDYPLPQVTIPRGKDPAVIYAPTDSYAREVERLEAAAQAVNPDAYKPLPTPQGSLAQVSKGRIIE